MGKLALALALLALCGSAFARDVYVKPHIRSDGTYVEGHHRSSPNNTKLDNFSTQGNYNPSTGEIGKRNPFADNDLLITPRRRK